MEQVLVVKEEIIMPLLSSDGIYAVVAAILANHTYIDRPLAENDPSYKQIIPYVMAYYQDQHLLLRRSKNQGEARLHGKFSLGIGGHINPETPMEGFSNIIEASLRRELDEEVVFDHETYIKPLCTIYDPSSTVGQVHVGLAYAMEVTSPGFTVGEPEQMTARWASRADLLEVYDLMETWTQILFDRYIR